MRAAALALAAAALGAMLGAMTAGAFAGAQMSARDVFMERVCTLIGAEADRHALPRDFLARLLWKESRFDPDAVSPAGAEGIAQFMPGTARLRRLEDPFDPDAAIRASAAYLADLRRRFGNLGLAAAAYNAGEGRVGRWRMSGGFLPLETEDYVLSIMGAPADLFLEEGTMRLVPVLSPGRDFFGACRDLPARGAQTVAMATRMTKPWAVQVAGALRRTAAAASWQRVQARHAALLQDSEPVISRVRSPRGRAGVHAVRIGADSRAEADRICNALRAGGGSCVVLRNR